MPHHTHEIEVCIPHGRRLGIAYLADWATPERRAALRRTRAARARRLRAGAKAAEQLRRDRFAPAATPADARRPDALTAPEAARDMARHRKDDLAKPAPPDLIPPAPPPPDRAEGRGPPAVA
ncbi:hypothetical protein [Embleya scabrispora]|uniref:hypothetical protein n=1 Tax=Embleya scabrispora TaxID=159449 RepID=UPI000366460C|nr:hypothetical protein [Embleya scabrispora]MYS79603.1 hypothetical protein [Streptomyces sp. SID5474]